MNEHENINEFRIIATKSGMKNYKKNKNDSKNPHMNENGE